MVSRRQLLLTLFILSLSIHVSFTTTHQHHHLHRHRRRLLHQPLFPLDSLPPSHPPSLSPQTQPQKQQPKHPFSSASSSSTPQKPFFPFYHSALTPPAPTSIATFPANISSLLLPQTTSKPHRHVLGISLAVSFISVALIAGLLGFLYYRRNHKFSPVSKKLTGPDCLRLYPPNIATSDGSGVHKPPPHTTSNSSAEFLYFGTLANSREIDEGETSENSLNAAVSAEISSTSSPHDKIGSPELKPLPPLPRHNFVQDYRNVKQEEDNEDEEEEEEFFSPRGSSGRQENVIPKGSSSCRMFQSLETDHFGNRSFNSRSPSPSYRLRSNPVSPSITVSNSPSPPSILSPVSLKSKSPDSLISFPLPLRPLPPRPVIPSSPPLSSSNHSPSRNFDFSDLKTESPTVRNHLSQKKIPPPPPPPPPPARYWEVPVQVPAHSSSGPPVLTRPVLFKSAEQLPSNGGIEKNEETPKLKLKPLHWDKVRASSDRAMVWDQIKSSSFQLDEEMIESLFTTNNLNSSMKENGGRRQILPFPNQENRALDPKKSQNIAILLRALNVTIDEVCEALLEGNLDTMGTELLESLLKMAPTKEEEWKLKEFKDESPFKLGPAEKFLKAVLDVPFAFKRVDAMLYVVNFDSEIEYLRRSFETLEMACKELKNSRMFLKLLEAVLKTGNHMNVGTNRGDAHAFKLDTLLKLVDVKGTDGKTTLLHFVMQEIIRVEGSKLSNSNDQISTVETTSLADDVEFRKLGLQVVSGLSGELLNVKKAAAMDSDVLSSEAGKLAEGIKKIYEVVKMNEETGSKESRLKFSENMNAFLKRGEEDIVKIQAQESVALSMVKEITEYFHGNSAKEEAHPFRIFMVVRDFLSVLDQFCKEVGKINKRSMVGSTKQFSVPVSSNPVLQPVFTGFITGK